MRKFNPRRRAVMAIVILTPFALLATVVSLTWPASAGTSRVAQQLVAEDTERQTRHADLRSSLSSTSPHIYREALDALAALDEPGAIGLWQAAMENPDIGLRKEAWERYHAAAIQLARKELVPRIARLKAPAHEVLQHARALGVEAVIWSTDGTETVAAAPPYLLERLRRASLDPVILYDSVVDWQQARAKGDLAAASITPAYQSPSAASRTEVRIAVIEKARRLQPVEGYSDWLGDHENVLMSNDSFIAYLDLFSSDGSPEALQHRSREQYVKRGYSLAGFFTPAEFAREVERFFPGKTFDAGQLGQSQAGEIRPALADGRFHSYDETLAEFTSLAREYPDLARLVNLGPTYENRQIFALKVTRDPAINDSSKPEVLVFGGSHAREWISVEPPVYFVSQLVKGYATNDSIKHLVDNLQIWIVPILNPDGLTYSQGQSNDILDGVRMWRKNRRPIVLPECGSDVGVDINRNYGYQWRLRGDEPCPSYSDDNGGSDDPRSELYRGTGPDSELEVKAIKTLLDDPSRNFRAQIDYHNYSQLILYPWGFQRDAAPDNSSLKSLAAQISDEMFKMARQVYRPLQSVDLYGTSITGSSLDYAYGMRQVPMPFVIELRPTCCNFNVSESDIAEVNQESWAGAQVLFNWSAGPPILESVKAYQATSDGSFSKLVYSARWVKTGAASGNSRQLVVDTRFPGLEPGRIKVSLQFSKPMRITDTPVATLGRRAPFDELRLGPSEGEQGWQKTVYANDTWVGEAIINENSDQTEPWHLNVSALDNYSLKLDALPATVASYTRGSDRWAGYESPSGEGAGGGADLQHVLAPTLRGGFLNIFIGSPNGGERLTAGEPYLVTWRVPRETGFMPVQQEIWLSTDGGARYTPIAQGISGSVEKLLISFPRTSTTAARLRVSAREGSLGNTIFGDNLTSFTLADNVGSGVDISLLSSERLDLNWSEAPSDELPDGASGTTRLALSIAITNRGGVAVANPFVRISELSGANVLLSRDSKSKTAASARQSIDAGGDNLLSPGETAHARLTIGLLSRKKLKLSAQLYGVPVGGTIGPAEAVRLWKGKPKTK